METKIGKAINKVEARQEVRFWSQIYNLFILQMSKIGKSPILYFSLIFFPLLFVVGVGVLIPTTSNFTPSMSLTIIAVSGLIFADLHFGIEKTTLRSQSNISNYGPKTRMFSIIIITFLITTCATIINILLMMSLETYTDLLLSEFVFNSVTDKYNLNVNWKLLPWAEICYYLVVTNILMISIWSFFKIFVADYKLFVMIVFTYLIMNIVFGGILVADYSKNSELYGDKIYNSGWLKGEEFQLFDFKTIYSYAALVTPTYFNNVLFSSVLRIGASQDIGIYGWDDSMNFFWNPSVIEGVWPSYVNTFDTAWQTNDINLINEAYIYSLNTMSPYTSILKPNGDGIKFILVITPFIYIFGLLTLGFTKKI